MDSAREQTCVVFPRSLEEKIFTFVGSREDMLTVKVGTGKRRKVCEVDRKQKETHRDHSRAAHGSSWDTYGWMCSTEQNRKEAWERKMKGRS